jgi:hypothetical protein
MFDVAAPADERTHATKEAWKQVRTHLDTEHIARIQEGTRLLMADHQAMNKAIQMRGWFSQVSGAQKRRMKHPPGHDSILYLNEFGLVSRDPNRRNRWVEKPTAGGFAFLREVIGQVDLLKATIMVARQEIMNFAQPIRSKQPLGYRIKRRDGEKEAKADIPNIRRIEEWLSNCGDIPERAKREKIGRDTFRTFLAKHVWDSLSLDAGPIELERPSPGTPPTGMYTPDAATVRLCTEQGYEGDDSIRAIQVIDSAPYTAYTYDDILYNVRNPRTDLIVNGYGYAESEMVIRMLTAWLSSFEFNRAGMDRNAIPRKILAMTGFEQRELNAMAEVLRTRLTGAGNQFKLPLIGLTPPNQQGQAGKDIQVIDIDQQLNDMFLHKWMTLIASIVTAPFGMHPGQINMSAFDAAQSSPLSGSDTEEKLANARDKGLLPRLAYFGAELDQIVYELDPRYEFEFGGFNEEDPQRAFEREKLTATVNEMRDAAGQPPHPIEIIGNAPADNPALLQLYMASLGVGPEVDEGDESEPRASKSKAPKPAKPAKGQKPLTKAFTIDMRPPSAIDQWWT